MDTWPKRQGLRATTSLKYQGLSNRDAAFKQQTSTMSLPGFFHSGVGTVCSLLHTSEQNAQAVADQAAAENS